MGNQLENSWNKQIKNNLKNKQQINEIKKR